MLDLAIFVGWSGFFQLVGSMSYLYSYALAFTDQTAEYVVLRTRVERIMSEDESDSVIHA